MANFHSHIDISDEDVNFKESDFDKSRRYSKNNLQNIIQEQIDEKHMDDFSVLSSNTKCGKRKEAAEILISDEDVNSDECDLARSQHSSKNNIRMTNLEHIDEDHMDDFNFHSSNARRFKRKGAKKIVISDDESNDEDNAPIGTLKRQHMSSSVETTSEEEDIQNVSIEFNKTSDSSEYEEDHTDDINFHSSKTRRSKRKGSAKIVISDDDNAPISTLERQHMSSNVETSSKEEAIKNVSIDLNKTFDSSEEEDNDGDDERESESQISGSFIVDSSETDSNCESESGDGTAESMDFWKDYKETMEMVGRKKILNFKWDFEGDMLSDFGKYPEVCMRAVCALYRQQTDDEKESKETKHHNERGFSQPDAPRGSKLAEFLMDGDHNGDLKKTVEELLEYDSNGIKLCWTLAVKYSKQLFMIYKNKEDPYFMPS